jgi:hypothetical protein
MASETATALAVRKEEAVEVVEAKPCPEILASHQIGFFSISPCTAESLTFFENRPQGGHDKTAND